LSKKVKINDFLDNPILFLKKFQKIALSSNLYPIRNFYKSGRRAFYLQNCWL